MVDGADCQWLDGARCLDNTSMSSVDMAPRSFAQEVHANFMESLMVMSRALSRPTMGAKELCSWSTLSTRLAKLLREEAIVMTRTGKLLLCIAFIGFSSIDGGRNAVMSVPTLPILRHQGAANMRHYLCTNFKTVNSHFSVQSPHMCASGGSGAAGAAHAL